MLWFSRSKPRWHGLLLDRQLDSDERCLDCDAVCCRAFPSVPLDWGEYERLRLLGATRLHFSLAGQHRLLIENGCEFLMAGRCVIYPDRPEVCRRFYCSDGVTPAASYPWWLLLAMDW